MALLALHSAGLRRRGQRLPFRLRAASPPARCLSTCLLLLLPLLLLVAALAIPATSGPGTSPAAAAAADFVGNASGSGSSLWVVLVGTSRNWLNYRDNSNTVALYRMFRGLGVPDSHILLMLGHSMACDPRNPHPGQLFANPDHAWELYQEPIEVDYRGAEVNVDNFLRLVSGLHFPGTPASKQLRSDSDSHVFMYLTGHGGDKFLKFQDKEELQASELGEALHLMHLQGRYKSILLMADTCQADTMLSQIRSPGIVGIASSAKGENSYSYLPDSDLGVSVVDRFSFTTLRFVEDAARRAAVAAGMVRGSEDAVMQAVSPSLQDLFNVYDRGFLMSTPCLRPDHFGAPMDQVPALRYFMWPGLLTGTPVKFPTAQPVRPLALGSGWTRRNSAAAARAAGGLKLNGGDSWGSWTWISGDFGGSTGEARAGGLWSSTDAGVGVAWGGRETGQGVGALVSVWLLALLVASLLSLRQKQTR